jgi:murein L,D-transpeptidase YcbB/YkuD
VPLGETLKPDMNDDRVPALRARLAVTDGALPDAPPGRERLYDDELVAAVQSFQLRHGLDLDGNIGKQTVFAMNVSVEDRIQEIIVAMERWRWMPPELGADHLFVNIAGFDLRLVRAGTVADTMRVVVGKPFSRTPVFSDAVRTVELNPYWNVPTGIAIKEELPKLKSNPGGRAAMRPCAAARWFRSGPSTGAPMERRIFPSSSARSPAQKTRSAR